MDIETKKSNRYPSLRGNLKADIAIIGAGLAGVSAAYALSGSGKTIAVLEAKTIGSGITSKTTAFITQVVDTSLSDLTSMFGKPRAKMIWASGNMAINTFEEIIKKEKISCEFLKCPLYICARTQDELETISEDYRLAKKLGFKVKLHKTGLPFPALGFLEVSNQAKFNASKFIEQLSKRTVDKGVQIFENTAALKISGKNDFKIKTAAGVLTAKQIIIATYYPFGNPKVTHFKKGMYKSYVIKALISKGKLAEAMYTDINNPYHYFRVDKGQKHDTLIFGGEDHRAELPIAEKKNFKALEDSIKNVLPNLNYKIESRWSGEILEPSDGLPLIGQYAPGQFVATAFSGNGMTYSIISALMFKKMLLGQKHPWEKLYDPKRIPSLKQLAKKGVDYTQEFFGGAAKNIFK